MQKLEEWNKERAEQHIKTNDNKPRLNGIECPNCGCELFDSSPMVILASNPPQKNIACNACGYTGYRVV
jgi:hypothetical protein